MPDSDRPAWWSHAVLYEVYLRSFADASGDGVGDLAGLRSHVDHLVDLGVDVVWVTPWFPSPMADGGYDVVDYRDVDPVYGTLADVDALLQTLHDAGIRLVVDLVANHTSSEHPWFRAALASLTAPERSRYFFRDGRGADGELPPNDWISAFGGPAWTRTTGPDGTPGQWYLHLFAPEQPDLDWSDEAVLQEFDDVIRFWLDRGMDGLRLDAVPAMAKRPGLPDAGHAPGALFESSRWVDNPHWDVEEVHAIMRRWRRLADEHGPDEKLLIAEAVVRDPERLSRYLRPDELHSAFNFDFLRAGWNADALRQAIDRTVQACEAVGATPSWVLSSHDETRHVTRMGREDSRPSVMGFDTAAEPDLELGRRRARAAALLQLALPGMGCLYQGDELGLPEVTDIPEHLLQDPTWTRSGRTVRGRDGCRVPLPWTRDGLTFGFGEGGQEAWLPQPAGWSELSVEAQHEDPGSMLNLYRAAVRLRRQLGSGPLTWTDSTPEGVLDVTVGQLRCVVNLSVTPVPVPDGRVLLSSGLLDGSVLPPDAAVWLSAG